MDPGGIARALAIAVGSFAMARLMVWTSWHPGILPTTLTVAAGAATLAIAYPDGKRRRRLWLVFAIAETLSMAGAVATAATGPEPAGSPLAIAILGFLALLAALASGIVLAVATAFGGQSPQVASSGDDSLLERHETDRR